jgi:hypothetical protein
MFSTATPLVMRRSEREQSAPAHPSTHTHTPALHVPFELHELGQTWAETMATKQREAHTHTHTHGRIAAWGTKSLSFAESERRNFLDNFSPFGHVTRVFLLFFSLKKKYFFFFWINVRERKLTEKLKGLEIFLGLFSLQKLTQIFSEKTIQGAFVDALWNQRLLRSTDLIISISWSSFFFMKKPHLRGSGTVMKLASSSQKIDEI